MLVDVDSQRPLKFLRKVESKDGDEVTIEIKYEMLFKHCSTCGMLTHEKDHCPSAQRYTSHNEHRASDLCRYGPHMETSTRYLASSGYGKEDRKNVQRKPYSGEIRSTHVYRIVRHHSDREIVPYEQSSPIRYDALNGSIDHQGIRSGDGKTAKRLASTIVTPSRSGHDMEENVTKRVKGLTRSLSFTSLSEQAPAATDGDTQIIGALNDMDIEDQQEEEVMECDAPDEDLLGLELREMEETSARHDANMKTTGHDDNVHKAKALKISKQGTRANVPLGFQIAEKL
ncbi:hypothetical protein Bca52824_072111 [Brassica carinata]|uniref:Zinc knuckle CX2CX4HX4C domain-containing protein n=1 Tax=Brassica carinata TaxID=52824 RepID=A0A8X7Q8X9_BRACI|nr:hypothetical protein Bca52824_072111 [Brassica carinata]